MWTLLAVIWLVHSSTHSSMLDSVTTSSWWKLTKETVGYTRTRTTVSFVSRDSDLHLLIISTGMLSAAASLGLSLLWDTDVGLSHVDKYTYSSEEYIKVAILIMSSIVWY